MKKASGIYSMIEERFEQIHKHNRTVEQDVLLNSDGQLRMAAIALSKALPNIHDMPKDWDINICTHMVMKPIKERLIIAGALIAAEIDRLQAIEK